MVIVYLYLSIGLMLIAHVLYAEELFDFFLYVLNIIITKTIR